MKKFSKILSVALLVALVLSFGAMAYATDDETGETGETGTPVATTSTPSITITSGASAAEAQTDTTSYTWYRIFEAEIETDPTNSGPTQSGGAVAYYVDSQTKATAVEGTGLFNVVRVGTSDKWYVELKNSSTSAQTIAEKFAAMDLTIFPTGTFAQTEVAGTATSGTVAPGYYYITSTAGSNVVIQTLTAVSITEKNEYVTDNKTIPEVDKNSEIGQVIIYDLIVNVPITANDQIVLTDTMSKGLSFVEIVSQSPIEGTATDPVAADNDATKFTITYTAEQIQNLVKDKTETQTITVKVKVKVNEEAAIDTGIPNTLDLKYGNNYEAVPKTVETKTTKFEFDKVDGTTNEQLTGAEFKLTKKSTNTAESTSDWINLVEVEAGKTYRIATADDTTTTTTIVTNGNTVTINGLDADVTYYLVETKAPTGYNKLDNPVAVTATTQETTGEGQTAVTTKVFVKQDIENNKGGVLPSTGGIGTTIFYVVGGVLVLAAIILLVTKKRMSE